MDFKTFRHKVFGRIVYFLYPHLPARTAIKMMYRYRFGKKLDLDHPRTYNEKLQWLKVNDIHPEYGRLVDKIEVKKHVADLIGEEHVIPTLRTYDTVDEIDWDALPERFVLKTNHGCGRMVICKDKSKLDIEAEKKMLREAMRYDYTRYNNEYPYRYVRHRLLVEPFMEDETGELRDYKFFCFDGEPFCLFVTTDRSKEDVETKYDFYDMDWNFLPFTNDDPNSGVLIPRPAHFEEMKEIASKLSKGYPHVRVDLYNINGIIYFGELTFFSASGLDPFDPEEWDYILGEKIKLPV